ncbi:MAG TPA: tannase/feruloyl esterase family alpha/beta hydrolase [Candidatus Binataceae bacterium]|nr:tannase/feruloyl esterase family alpha/beta hydrolase [Candidatus Binataceae bacterium]
MRCYVTAILLLGASITLRVTQLYALSCDAGSIQAIAPGSSTVTSALETTTGTIPYCKIDASITTDAALGDVIHYEVDLPDASSWNSRLFFFGNGGFGGSIVLSPGALQAGSAVAATDTGHTAANDDASWALNNVPAVLDYEYKALHETVAASEQILSGYYGAPVYHSYFSACSDGGRQGLVEAQKYPNDFDGVVVGDAGIGQAYLGFNWNAQAILAGSSSFIDGNAIGLINSAVLAQCDGVDGVVDGLIQNPVACNFNPETLLCAPGQATGCLSAGQIVALNKIYQGAVDTNGVSLYPGLSVSDPAQSASLDAGWATYMVGCRASGVCQEPNFTAAEPWASLARTPSQWGAQDEFFKDFIFNNPNYDTRTLKFTNQTLLNQIGALTASLGGEGMNANLTSFAHVGHKLIMYHGWSDPAFSPYVSVNYYNGVSAILGSSTTNSARLFMVPGMHHCQGLGPGPNSFDVITAITNWVEQGIAPDGIIASHHMNDDSTQPVDRTMPLCAYPEMAVYNGVGPVDTAASWSCGTSGASSAS